MEMDERIRQAMKGDEDAFYEVIVLHKDRLYRIALAYFRNEEDALEVIQEMTYRAWKTIRKLRQPEYFSTWLIRILLNCCHDEWKRQKRLRRKEMINECEMRDEESETQWVGRLYIAEALDRLEPKYKQVLILKYYEDMTLTDIAAALHRPVGTVKTWLHKALVQMKSLVSGEEEVEQHAEYEGAN